jgi:hypothetical protein
MTKDVWRNVGFRTLFRPRRRRLVQHCLAGGSGRGGRLR